MEAPSVPVTWIVYVVPADSGFVFTLLDVVCGARVRVATVLTAEEIVPAVTEVPNTYVVPLVTASARAAPVLAAKVLEMVAPIAVMVAL